MYGTLLVVLPHVIGNTNTWWDDIFLFVGALLVPVFAALLFRLGRWANKAGEEQDERKPSPKPKPKKK